MEVEYLRELRQNYLMIQVEEHQEQGYEARMLTGNAIEGLLKFRIKKADNRCRFCYEITSKQPLSRMLEKQAMNAEQIRTLLLGIARTLTRMEDYLLTEEQIVLDPDYVYIDPEEYQPFLCLLPGKKGSFPEEFSRFLQFLLGKTDHEDNEAVVLIYGLYRESLKENYGLDNLLRWLQRGNYPNMKYGTKEELFEKIETEDAESRADQGIIYPQKVEEPEKACRQERRREEDGRSGQDQTVYLYFLPGAAMLLLAAGIWLFGGRYALMRSGVGLAAAGCVLLAGGGILFWHKHFTKPLTPASSVHPFISNQNSQFKTPVQPVQWQMVFEEPRESAEEATAAVDIHEEMRTVLLWDQGEEKTTRSLVSRDGEKDILLPYYPFVIGKQEGICDYVLDKSTVSRLHVRIDETEAGYRVTDLNSTNGTFINGRPLEANGAAMVQLGDEIGVADLKFQFK